MLMRTYLHNNGEHVTFSAIAKPQNDFDSIKAVLKAGLAHEQYVTSLINKIYQAADKVHDYRTMQCFDWFVKEQGEEEKNADDLIKKYKMFGSDAKGLYALNQELLAHESKPEELPDSESPVDLRAMGMAISIISN